MNTTERHQLHRPRIRARGRAAAPRAGHARAIEAALLALLVALAFGAMRDAHAGTYKWTDDKGVVHYADKLPADAVNHARVQLDSQGFAVKRTEAALTPEQLRAKYGDIEKQRQAMRDKQAADRRDYALIATYAKEADIDLARSRALVTIDGQMQSARVYVAQLTKRQQELLEKKIAAGSRGVAPAVERELESIDSELAKTNSFIAQKKDESAAATARYDAEKQRWRELVEIAKAEAAREKARAIPAQAVGGDAVNVVPVGAGPR